MPDPMPEPCPRQGVDQEWFIFGQAKAVNRNLLWRTGWQRLHQGCAPIPRSRKQRVVWCLCPCMGVLHAVELPLASLLRASLAAYNCLWSLRINLSTTQEDCSKTRCCNELGTTCQTKSQSELFICWTVCSCWPKATLVIIPFCRWRFQSEQLIKFICIKGLLLHRTKLAPHVIHRFVLPPVQVLSEEWLVGILQSQLHRRQMWKSRTCIGHALFLAVHSFLFDQTQHFPQWGGGNGFEWNS